MMPLKRRERHGPIVFAFSFEQGKFPMSELVRHPGRDCVKFSRHGNRILRHQVLRSPFL